MKHIFKYKNVIIISLLCCLIIFSEFIFQGKKFEIIADQQLQYHLFYKEWIRLIKDFFHSGEFPFYSWYSFFGNRFFCI